MGEHVVLVGGGHAHLTTIVNMAQLVRRGHRVTLINPSPYHYYSGMGPGMLGGFYTPEQIRFPVQQMAEEGGAEFMKDRLVRIDPQKRILSLESGDTLHYDVVSFNIGSYVPAVMADQREDGVFPVKPIENLVESRRSILRLLKQKHPRIVVVGGGPSGVEIAGNLCKLVKDHGGNAHLVLIAGTRLLERFPPRARKLALRSLQSRGVMVREGIRVDRLVERRAWLNDGSAVDYDLCFVAVGLRPAPVFKTSALPVGKGGGLLVNDFLQCVAYPRIFGAGDCICFASQRLDKVGVYAVRQNPVLYENLLAAVRNRSLTRFEPGGKYLLIFNLGDGSGIFCRGTWVWKGKSALLLKDYIDKRFMQRFQPQP